MKGIRKRVLLIILIGLVVARAAFYEMNPLAIGYFTAAYLESAGSSLLIIAMLLGIGSVMTTPMVIKYLFVMIISVIMVEAPIIKKRNIPKSAFYMLPPIVLGIYNLIGTGAHGWNAANLSLAVLEMLISYISGVVFKRAIEVILQEEKGYRMNNEQTISLAFLIAVIIYAVPEFNNSYLAPVETVVFFIILFFTYKYGVGQGCVAGAVSGFTMSLRGGPIADIGILTMMGIVPAIFREMGRIPTATIFSVTAGFIGLIYREMAFSTREIGALVSAILIFLLLPRSMIYRADAENDAGVREYKATQNLRKIANTKMKIFSESFLKLSKILDVFTVKQTELRQQEINLIFEDISEKLCKNCSKCSICWEKNFDDTYKSACSMFEAAQKNGFIRREDVPSHFLQMCTCTDQFIIETNKGFEIAKLNYIWGNKMAESREVIAEQLRDVSSAIQDITGDIYKEAQVIRLEEEKVCKRLRAEHIHVRNIDVLERSDQHREVYLSASAAGNRCITAREVSVMVGEALGIKIRVSDASKTVLSKEYEDFIFIEDTKYKVLTGIARAMKDTVSGDNFSILKLETGESMIALSDGMGTGKEAGDESETVLALLEQLIESGFKPEMAIKLINSSLVLKADKQTFSTIDMCIMNLFTGMCEFIKAGAAAAFIKRENWVETISSATLPIGIFGSTDFENVTKKLYNGDIVILVTDGVLDCIREENKEAILENVILELKSSNPQEIANRILDYTLSQSNYVPVDDMTVITAGFWLK